MRISAKDFHLTTAWKLGCVFLLLWGLNGWAAESPLEIVRQTTDQAVAVLHNPSLKDHVQEISKRCLGPQWNALTEDQRQQFVQLFIELVKRSYEDTLEHQTKDAQFSFDQEHIEGDTAEVDTHVLTPSQDKPFTVNYRLHQLGGKWQIYDIVAENVSLVRNYHNQFDRILRESSYDGLVQALKKKIQNPDA